MNIKKVTKYIEDIVKQGNNEDILKLHEIIFDAHKKEFTEDNLPTLVDFIMENTLKSFNMQSNPDLYKRICSDVVDRILGVEEPFKADGCFYVYLHDNGQLIVKPSIAVGHNPDGYFGGDLCLGWWRVTETNHARVLLEAIDLARVHTDGISIFDFNFELRKKGWS